MLGFFTSNRDPIEFPVVANLRLNNFDLLQTDDIGPEVINEAIRIDQVREVEYIKTPHHGSKNSLTQELLVKTFPGMVIC